MCWCWFYFRVVILDNGFWLLWCLPVIWPSVVCLYTNTISARPKIRNTLSHTKFHNIALYSHEESSTLPHCLQKIIRIMRLIIQDDISWFLRKQWLDILRKLFFVVAKALPFKEWKGCKQSWSRSLQRKTISLTYRHITHRMEGQICSNMLPQDKTSYN